MYECMNVCYYCSSTRILSIPYKNRGATTDKRDINEHDSATNTPNNYPVLPLQPSPILSLKVFGFGPNLIKRLNK